MTDSTEITRRRLMQTAAGVALAQLAPDVLAQASPPTASTAAPPTPGKPGDFNFLAGEWKISHRRLKDAASKTWDEFSGEATCWTILGGVGSVEELRIPARNFSGMGLRLLDVEKKVWSDFWVNAKSGVLTTPGTTGSFEKGVGTFEADDEDAGKPIKVRGVWDRITPTSCRWYQEISNDGGKTWQLQWTMDWRRA